MEKLQVNHRDPSEWTLEDRREAAEKVQLAKTHLALRQPFFAVLAMNLRTQPHPCHPFKTMMVNSHTIYYNVDYVLALSHKETLYLICHETCHPAFGHLFRRGTRAPLRWNMAIDFASNCILDQYKLGSAPNDGGCRDSKYNGMTAEEIYDQLEDDAGDGSSQMNIVMPDGEGSDGSSGGGGDPSSDTSGTWDGHDFGDGGPEKSEQEERKWQKRVVEAVEVADQTSEGQGSVPAEIRRMVSELVSPKVPWQRELMPYVQMVAADDYNWRYFNRRYLSLGMLLPKMKNPGLPEVLIHIDTSGSMSTSDITDCVSEVMGILQTYTPEKLHFAACDAGMFDGDDAEVVPNHVTVLDHHEMMNTDHVIEEITESLAGGGGTSFVPTFNYIRKNPGIQLAIMMTDGYGTFPDTDEWAGYPTFWMSTEAGMAADKYPFGKAVKI